MLFKNRLLLVCTLCACAYDLAVPDNEHNLRVELRARGIRTPLTCTHRNCARRPDPCVCTHTHMVTAHYIRAICRGTRVVEIRINCDGATRRRMGWEKRFSRFSRKGECVSSPHRTTADVCRVTCNKYLWKGIGFLLTIYTPESRC